MAMDILDVNSCDREPIHIPGSIQPDGVMLVVERETLSVRHAAGDVAGWLGRDDWQGALATDLLHEPRLAADAARVEAGGSALLYRVAAGYGDGLFDVHIFAAGRWLAIELERSPERSVASTSCRNSRKRRRHSNAPRASTRCSTGPPSSSSA